MGSLDRLLERARHRLMRLQPHDAHDAVRNGTILVDIRPEFQRRTDGEIPGAVIVERNHLEWPVNSAGTLTPPRLAPTLAEENRAN